MGSRKNIDQGSNDSSEPKVTHIEKFTGRKCHSKNEKNLCGADPADSRGRGSVRTGVEILVYAKTIAIAKCSCHSQETGGIERENGWDQLMNSPTDDGEPCLETTIERLFLFHDGEYESEIGLYTQDGQ